MEPISSSTKPISSSTDNYLYYVIKDNNQKIRGHIIGVQHWVEPKDQDFNDRIRKAIDHSARVILEIPPDSAAPLLPSEENSKKFKVIIEATKENLKSISKSEVSSETTSINAEIENLLKDIKDKCLKAGDKDQQSFEELKKELDGLTNSKEKLLFLKEIQRNIFDFNLVSLERNINKKVVEAKKEINSLEKGDLNKKLLEADLKLGLRKIRERISDPDYQKIIEQLNDIGSNEKKLEFVEQQKSLLGIENIPPMTFEEVQALRESMYRAWVNGDVKELVALLKTAATYFKEEPEFEEVHQSRDKQMAERIIEVVNEAKGNEEVSIMMGCDHLIYTKRTNILDYLDQHFKSDLQGWSIKQVTNNSVT